MNMIVAIAHSAGNKARAYSDDAQTVIVQKLMDKENEWFHLWKLGRSNKVVEVDIWQKDLGTMQQTYEADPNADYWQPV